jgi:hypothetical protein
MAGRRIPGCSRHRFIRTNGPVKRIGQLEHPEAFDSPSKPSPGVAKALVLKPRARACKTETAISFRVELSPRIGIQP